MARAITNDQLPRKHHPNVMKMLLATALVCASGFAGTGNQVLGQATFRTPTIQPARDIGGQELKLNVVQQTSPFRSISTTQERGNNGLQTIDKSLSGESQSPASILSGIDPKQADLLKPRFETITERAYQESTSGNSGGFSQYQDGSNSRLIDPRSNLSGQVPYDTTMAPSTIQQGGQGDYEQLEVMPPELTGVPEQSSDDGHEEILQYYPNGELRIRRYVRKDDKGNYIKDGPWIYYDKSKRVIAAGRYRDGIMHGQWQRIHTQDEGGMFLTKPFTLFTGSYQSSANFNRGKLEGAWTITDQYRRKIFEVGYKNGIRNGLATWWYPNGMKMRQATFDNGLLNGPITDWDENQKIVGTQPYIKGRKLVRNTSYYRPKVPQSEEQFLEAKLEPSGEDNWWDAKPASYVPVGSRIQDGPIMEWYENGQRKKRGAYRNDLEVGQFTWWHNNGNKQIAGQYVKGLKQGVWTWWFENGMKQIEGTYRDGEPAGIWRAWEADGMLRKEENFSLENQVTPVASDETRQTSEAVENSDNSATETDTPTAEVLPEPQPVTDPQPTSDPYGSTEEITPIEFEDTTEALESTGSNDDLDSTDQS